MCKAGEVVFHVLEDEVEAAGHAGGDETVKLDDVGVVEAAEDEDLARHEADALGLKIESARRGVQPSMASPATAESQAGQPAATCSPRALFAKLPPGAGRDKRERLSRRAGFSAGAAGCSGFPVAAASCGGAGAGSGGCGGGRSGLDAEGRP
nr:unnamed protein product [Digitaria exilis]